MRFLFLILLFGRMAQASPLGEASIENDLLFRAAEVTEPSQLTGLTFSEEIWQHQFSEFDGFHSGPFQLQANAIFFGSFTDQGAEAMLGAKAATQPFLRNSPGDFYSDGGNGFFSADLVAMFTRHVRVQATPIFSLSEEDLEFQGQQEFDFSHLYVSLLWRKLAMDVGRAPIEWGVGKIDRLVLSGAHEYPWMVRLRNTKSVLLPWWFKYMGPMMSETFVAILDDKQTFANPWLVGTKLNFAPSKNSEFGMGYTVTYGGTGSPASSGLVVFAEAFDDASNATNRNFVFDARYIWPTGSGEFYGEFLVEDCCFKVPINPRDVMNLFGVRFNRFLGFDRDYFDLEWTRTNFIAYRHGTILSGYTFRNRVLGHEIGPDGHSLQARWTHLSKKQNSTSVLASFEWRAFHQKDINERPLTDVLNPAFEERSRRLRLELSHLWRFYWPGIFLRFDLGVERVFSFAYLSDNNVTQYHGALAVQANLF